VGDARRAIGWAFLLNLSFAAFELACGYFSGSLAILADAIHDAGDSLALALAFGFEHFAMRGRDDRYSYGYRRLSLLSAAVSSLLILAASGFVLFAVVKGGFHRDLPRTGIMMGAAALGLAVNGFAAWRLQRGRTQNEKVLTWHLVEDALGWGAVLIGAIIMWFRPDWAFIDPLLALLVTLFIVWNVLRTFRQSLRLFLQAWPENFSEADFRARVLAVPGVEALHDLHVWSLDGDQHVVSMHIVVKGAVNATTVKSGIAESLRELGRFHLTVETESAGDLCREDCE